MSKLIGRQFAPGPQTFTRQSTVINVPYQVKDSSVQSNFESLSRQLGQLLFQLQEQVDLINQQLNPEYVKTTEVTDHVGGEDIPAGSLAIKNSVDLSTAEVTNKDADNISESATRKWAAETGADVTSANTAAAITGQGALATKNSVAAAEIDSGAVTEAKLGTGAVTEDKLGAGAVTNAKIGAGAVDTDELAANAVDTVKVAANAITAAKINTGAVGATQLASSAVTTDKIAGGAVTNVKCGWGSAYQPSGANDTLGLVINAVKEIQDEISADYTITKTVTGGATES